MQVSIQQTSRGMLYPQSAMMSYMCLRTLSVGQSLMRGLLRSLRRSTNDRSPNRIGDARLRDRPVLTVDALICTGRTLLPAGHGARRAEARWVIVLVTHGQSYDRTKARVAASATAPAIKQASAMTAIRRAN